MKKLLSILFILFSIELNAQDRDTFTICNGVKIYTEYRAEESSLSVRSNVNFLDDVDLNNVEGVLHTVTISMYKQHLVLDEDFIPSRLTEKLLDTLSIYWCGELFERTPTGLKQDTIYDYGTHTPKEVDSLEEAGYVVIRHPSWSITSGTLSFLKVTYDTVEVQGLAFYISNEDFTNGVDFKLLPTIKTVVKCKNCFTQTYHYNGFKFTADKTLKAEQLNVEKSHWWNGIFYEGWQEVDLTKYKEFIFIEKPK